MKTTPQSHALSSEFYVLEFLIANYSYDQIKKRRLLNF